ncbi:DUF2884 family protein [Aerolutibacter ruishenii]|uniref:DUF2884 family protein n=1 Tax=Aerolutibacter ruishenii TaxID=686800 RepID=A0A562LRT4_9GAMM|nr:DUF2884 family protein [Lysobacter ruishenii]TWI10273.1 Protein of unknown function (DUF2884) [Lysobacter ruishenii]
MRRAFALAVLALGGVNAAASEAGCRVESDYELTLDPRSLILVRDAAPAKAVVMRQGRLFVDDAWVNLDAEDSRRIAAFEQGTREAMPEAQAIGRAAADIAFAALGEVAAGFSSDPRATHDKLAAARGKLDARLTAAVSPHRFDGRDLGTDISEAVAEAIPSLIGDIVGGAISAAFTGDKSRLERMEHLDAEVEAAVTPRAAMLESRASALCQRLQALDAIEDGLEFRLPDGRRLDVLRVVAPSGAAAGH